MTHTPDPKTNAMRRRKGPAIAGPVGRFEHCEQGRDAGVKPLQQRCPFSRSGGFVDASTLDACGRKAISPTNMLPQLREIPTRAASYVASEVAVSQDRAEPRSIRN
jgi:hypothetical protein